MHLGLGAEISEVFFLFSAVDVMMCSEAKHVWAIWVAGYVYENTFKIDALVHQK